MNDIVDKKTRSRMMAGIRNKNTKPEILVRKELFARGYRFRLHSNKISGRPDIILPKHNVAIQTYGCFWHGHTNCALFRLPKSRQVFWDKKITGNIRRDRETEEQILESGLRLLTIWECALKGKHQLDH